ncbi:hypothetical protein MTX26_35595 (plasmid) [Bradyrhizobium sp. ISRA443]|uniref:hypothetical protein n=1 Tax=unclassified Bradyrhizobium TaxID=2631580 RepID=UPI00247A607E|nr:MULTISPECIES: hypothetical protein [unclassified Bradyrhizobium]WGR90747.1 hypothetical protein MTX20_01460 [Bradyrhizobium sp. ISRA435]WGS03119.1 hypothetical protein MTX23_35025 [Bradyrhizobium sp. ISRA436]WGS10086.1 hypothetical protein MTX18_35590 [Bradyrhizobium sp. ISRA437]WGS16972.1 hypothetical protein MTX26_35595 [Bradyrhizobium sp. ISRA443]
MKCGLQILLLSFSITCVHLPAAAEEQIVLRGAIEKQNGPVFVLKTHYGAQAKFTLGVSSQLVAVEPGSFEIIKPGTMLRAVESASGSRGLLELQVLSQAVQEAVQSRSGGLLWSDSSNIGIVSDVSSSADGYRISIKDGSHERSILAPTRTPVVMFDHGKTADVNVGTAVVAADGKKTPEGLVEIDLLIYGRDGAVPNL